MSRLARRRPGKAGAVNDLVAEADVAAKQDGGAARALAERALRAFERAGDAEEFGLACAFLCGAKSGFITGQNILLDGGAYPGTM